MALSLGSLDAQQNDAAPNSPPNTASNDATQGVDDPWDFARDPRENRPYDPFEGIDRQNRVAKPDLPDDLAFPGRWRFTPYGRLKPGNMLDRFFVTSFVSPLFFREEDIGVGGGIALTDLDFRNLGGRELANITASLSEEGQQRFRINWNRWMNHRFLPLGVIRDERSGFGLELDYSRTLTRRFFGFGSRSAKGAETSYTEEAAVIGAGATWTIPAAADDLMLNLRAEYQHHGLQRGRVESVPSTDEVAPFARSFADGDGVDQLWLRAGIARDTRDSLSQPYDGWRVGARIDAVPIQTGLDAGLIATTDAQVVLRVPPLFHDGGDDNEQNPPTDSIALGVFVASTAGDLPYYNLPSLGGANTLRGYIQNRFTDRVATHGTFEYRFVVDPRGVRFTDTIRIERVGIALFYDFGTVADDLGDLFEGEYLDSYGAGLRVAFAREAVFRIDLGFSKEDSLLTVAFGNSF